MKLNYLLKTPATAATFVAATLDSTKTIEIIFENFY